MRAYISEKWLCIDVNIVLRYLVKAKKLYTLLKNEPGTRVQIF